MPSWRNRLCILLSRDIFDNKLFLLNPVTKPKETHVHTFGSLFIHCIILFSHRYNRFLLSSINFSEFQHWQNWFSRRWSTRSSPDTLWFPIGTPFVPLKTNTFSFWYCFIGVRLYSIMQSGIGNRSQHDCHCIDFIRVHCRCWNYWSYYFLLLSLLPLPL